MNQTRDPHYDAIRQRLNELAAFASGIIPHDIGGPGFEPEMSDAIEINKELFLLSRKVDAVLCAYGEYCRAYGMVSDDDVDDHFKAPLHDAIDGNATFCIEDGTRSRIQDMEDAAEDERADHDCKLAREAV